MKATHERNTKQEISKASESSGLLIALNTGVWDTETHVALLDGLQLKKNTHNEMQLLFLFQMLTVKCF